MEISSGVYAVQQSTILRTVNQPNVASPTPVERSASGLQNSSAAPVDQQAAEQQVNPTIRSTADQAEPVDYTRQLEQARLQPSVNPAQATSESPASPESSNSVITQQTSQNQGSNGSVEVGNDGLQQPRIDAFV